MWYFLPSVLRYCWLGDRKCVPPVKSWVLVCWWWRFDRRLARPIAPVVTTTCTFLAPTNPKWRRSGIGLSRLLWKMAIKRGRERIRPANNSSLVTLPVTNLVHLCYEPLQAISIHVVFDQPLGLTASTSQSTHIFPHCHFHPFRNHHHTSATYYAAKLLLPASARQLLLFWSQTHCWQKRPSSETNKKLSWCWQQARRV